MPTLTCYLEDEHEHDDPEFGCCECGDMKHCCGACPVFFPDQVNPSDPTGAYDMWFLPQTNQKET